MKVKISCLVIFSVFFFCCRVSYAQQEYQEKITANGKIISGISQEEALHKYGPPLSTSDKLWYYGGQERLYVYLEDPFKVYLYPRFYNANVGVPLELKILAGSKETTDVTSQSQLVFSNPKEFNIVGEGIIVPKKPGKYQVLALYKDNYSNASFISVTQTEDKSQEETLLNLDILPYKPYTGSETPVNFLAFGTFFSKGQYSVRDITYSVGWYIQQNNDEPAELKNPRLEMYPPGKFKVFCRYQGLQSLPQDVEVTSGQVVLDQYLLRQITIVPASLSVAGRARIPLLVFATYGDNSVEEVTKEVNWEESDKTILKKESGNIFVAKSVGVAKIQATFKEDKSLPAKIAVSSTVNKQSMIAEEGSSGGPSSGAVSAGSGGQKESGSSGGPSSGAVSAGSGGQKESGSSGGPSSTSDSSGVSGSDFGDGSGSGAGGGTGSGSGLFGFGGGGNKKPGSPGSQKKPDSSGGPSSGAVSGASAGTGSGLFGSGTSSGSSSFGDKGKEESLSDQKKEGSSEDQEKGFSGDQKNKESSGDLLNDIKDDLADLKSKVSAEEKFKQIKIVPPYCDIRAGEEKQLLAFGIRQNNTEEDITILGEWKSLDKSVATVNGGLVKAVSIGETKACIQYKDMKSECASVMVREPKLVSITLFPAHLKIVTGAQESLKAEGLFGDASRRNITLLVDWRTDNLNIAKMNKNKVKALKAGQTKIHAGYLKVESTPVNIEVVKEKYWLLKLIAKIIASLFLLIFMLYSYFYILTESVKSRILKLYGTPRDFIIALYGNLNRLMVVFGAQCKSYTPPLLLASLLDEKYAINGDLFFRLTQRFEEAKYSSHIIPQEGSRIALEDYNQILKIISDRHKKTTIIYNYLKALLNKTPLFIEKI